MARSLGRRLLQPVERTDQIADAVDGEAGVVTGGLDPRVPEQDLDVTDIHPGFQQMGGEGMAKRMRRDVLADPGVLGRLFHRPAHDIDRQGLVIDGRAGEQPDLRSSGLDIPLAQHRQDLGRQDGVAVLPTLPLDDADDHPRAVDVADLEVDQFGDAQPGGIAKGEHDPILEVRRVIEQPGDFVGGKHDGQLVGLADVFGDAEHRLVRQGDAVEEADTRHCLVDGRDRQAASRQLQAEQAQIVGRRFVGRAVDEGGELLDAVDVGDLGGARKAAQGHVVDQALAKRADGGGLGHDESLLLKVGRQGITRRGSRKLQGSATAKNRSLPHIFPLLLSLYLAGSAFAGEQFGIEDAFAHPTDVPAAVAADLQKHFGKAEQMCFADRKNTAQDVLEATKVDIGIPAQALLLKPKIPASPESAWGCLCGAYTCPMWIYSVEAAEVHQIWSSDGVSLEIVGHKDNGVRRLLLSSGSSGHQSANLYTWNGEKYLSLREKTVHYSEDKESAQQAENELSKFKIDAEK
jgi:hypothetical protein